MKITIKHVFIKTHHSMDQIKRYYTFFRCIYTIIITKISKIDFEMTLQMTFKIINNSINFNELMFTLFVFDVYFCMIELNAFFFILTQRTAAMRKIINEIKRFIVLRQMNDVFNTRNEFLTIAIHDFLLNSSILMF